MFRMGFNSMGLSGLPLVARTTPCNLGLIHLALPLVTVPAPTTSETACDSVSSWVETHRGSAPPTSLGVGGLKRVEFHAYDVQNRVQ